MASNPDKFQRLQEIAIHVKNEMIDHRKFLTLSLKVVPARKKLVRYGIKREVSMCRDDFILICMGIFNDSSLTMLICDFAMKEEGETVDYESVTRLYESIVFMPRIVQKDKNASSKMNEILNPNVLSKQLDTHLQRVLELINLNLRRHFPSAGEAYKFFDR